MPLTRINNLGITDGTITAVDLATGVGGKVLQVVQGTLTGSASTTSGTFGAVSLSATITPSSTSNKILILGTINGANASTANKTGFVTVYKSVAGGSFSNIAPAGSNLYASFGGNYDAGDNNTANITFTYLDSPSSTSSLEYKIYIAVETVGTFTINIGGQQSFIQLLEIKG